MEGGKDGVQKELAMSHNWLIYVSGYIIGLSILGRLLIPRSIPEDAETSGWILIYVLWAMAWVWVCINFIK